MIVVLFY